MLSCRRHAWQKDGGLFELRFLREASAESLTLLQWNESRGTPKQQNAVDAKEFAVFFRKVAARWIYKAFVPLKFSFKRYYAAAKSARVKDEGFVWASRFFCGKRVPRFTLL
jgi:hypothetical protein